MEGIVSAVKLAANAADNVYTILSDRPVHARSGIMLEPLERVSFNLSDGGDLKDVSVGAKGTKEECERVLEKFAKKLNLEKNAKAVALEGTQYKDTITKAMPKLVEAGGLFATRLVSGAPIIVRFHNDGDGSSGATALYKATAELQKNFFIGEHSVLWHMNRSIAYLVDSAFDDLMYFRNYNSVDRPLLLMTDFGTTPESEEPIKKIGEECDIIWIDHHLPYDGFPRDKVAHYINAWDFGGNSDTTAGLLTCIFAQVLSNIDVELLKQASLASDYSAFSDLKDAKAQKLALILDFMTSGKSSNDSQGTTPKQILAVIDDSARFEETYSFATKLLDEALAVGVSNIKSYKSGKINIHVLDFGHVAKLGYAYPLPGRYSSKLQEHMENLNGGNTITVVHYGNYISVRLSSYISDKVKLLGVINRLKEKGAIESGGGHSEAASVRVGQKNLDDAMKALLGELGVKGYE